MGHLQIGHRLQQPNSLDEIIVEINLADPLQSLPQLDLLRLSQLTLIVHFVMDVFLLQEQDLDLLSDKLLEDVLVGHLLEFVADDGLAEEGAQHEDILAPLPRLDDHSEFEGLVLLGYLLVISGLDLFRCLGSLARLPLPGF
jgi:hypothetical protein